MAKARASVGANDTRELIIEAALAVFTEKGFDGAKTREIAARAKVNHGLIPYYFKTKEKLWQAAADQAFGEMKTELGSLLTASSEGTSRERAGSGIRAHVRYIARNPEFVRLMYEEGKRRGPRMRWLVDRHVKPLFDDVAKLMQRQRSDERPMLSVDPVHFFYILAGSTGLIFHQAEECKRVSGVDPFDPEVVEEHARVVELFLLGPA